MNKEKQIEEMAKVMCGYYGTEKCYECRYCCDCHIKQEANRLYNAGYRKQIEAEWITDEEGYVTCSNCGEEHTWDEFRPPYCDMCGARMKGGAE